ncbi:glycoside hydrolase family protein [uncultured Endozoicomonas sp.]|uniref:glycoside hydrolase family protein n=1 Tax=uncultured Endozoicomonas sp. TaxID=432652 RepID=UPI00261192D8|nr:glycoside hydrolase family protein [uncultured Endozoicomonas sp.]
MNVVELIKLHEGLRLKPYRCTSNKLTIGYGRNIEDRGISNQEAETLLSNDISQVTIELEKKLTFMFCLDEVRRAVLIDMAFNMGVSGLLRFSKTLSCIRAGEYDEAAMEMLDSRWANQVGKRSIRLAEMMRTGKWAE